jgi:hypothetical protein
MHASARVTRALALWSASVMHRVHNYAMGGADVNMQWVHTKASTMEPSHPRPARARAKWGSGWRRQQLVQPPNFLRSPVAGPARGQRPRRPQGPWRGAAHPQPNTERARGAARRPRKSPEAGRVGSGYPRTSARAGPHLTRSIGDRSLHNRGTASQRADRCNDPTPDRGTSSLYADRGY